MMLSCSRFVSRRNVSSAISSYRSTLPMAMIEALKRVNADTAVAA
jgi:hypothetical protein